MGREHFGFGVVAMVSDEARGGTGAEFYFRGDRVVFARSASALALLFHQAVKLRDVDFDAIVSQHVFCEIERKPVGIVELEGNVTGNLLLFILDWRSRHSAISCKPRSRVSEKRDSSWETSRMISSFASFSSGYVSPIA